MTRLPAFGLGRVIRAFQHGGKASAKEMALKNVTPALGDIKREKECSQDMVTLVILITLSSFQERNILQQNKKNSGYSLLGLTWITVTHVVKNQKKIYGIFVNERPRDISLVSIT